MAWPSGPTSIRGVAPPGAGAPRRPGLGWASYSYEVEGYWDEVLGASGRPRAEAELMWRFLDRLGPVALRERQEDAEIAIRDLGITFAVYGGETNIDRPWPM